MFLSLFVLSIFPYTLRIFEILAFRVRCDGMAKIRRSVALVVEKFAASDVRLLLIVDKKWHIGIFSQCVLPGVGSVIDIEWRCASPISSSFVSLQCRCVISDVECSFVSRDQPFRYSPATNEITVLSWKKYTGYEPMDRFTVNNTGSATEVCFVFSRGYYICLELSNLRYARARHKID